MVYLHNRILLSNKKNELLIHELPRHPADLNKLEIKEDIPYDSVENYSDRNQIGIYIIWIS